MLDGLVKGATGSPCGNLFQVNLPNAATQRLCTHGPDPAPDGVDVTRQRSASEILSVSAGSTPAGTVPCDGDGSSGYRVQALYVVASDRTDRFASFAGSFPTWAGAVSATYDNSAAQTGGSRKMRFVTNADGAGGCTLDVRKVVVDSLSDDTFSATITAVQAAGFNRTDRKYLMWVDANVYCGIGNIYLDDRATQDNANNGYYAQYSRVDSGCWGASSHSVEAHELTHNLGGVQQSAPNATPNLHCSDESDLMCYDDDGTGPVVMRQVCPLDNEWALDCNHDDYFSTNPPANSYLATHWNVASSRFLITGSVAPPPPPPTTITTTYTGSLTKSRLTRSQSFSTKAGAVSVKVSWTGKATSATVRLKDGAGNVVATATGASGLTVSATAATAGNWSFEVSATNTLSYTAQVTTPA